MSASTIRSLQTVRFLNVQDGKSSARDEKTDALSKQKDQVAETFDNRMESVSEMKDAREKSSWGTLIGTIALPVIGTLIGKGIGSLASSGDRKAMNAANLDAGMSELKRSGAQDDFAKASENFDSAQSQQSQLEKFSKELRQAERSLNRETF
jgi:uncharacterized membrane protein